MQERHTHACTYMADDSNADENIATIFSRSLVQDLVSGRQTVFCCLSCGVPFALPNDAYLYKDDRIQEFIIFVHGVRKQIGIWDRTLGSNMQWNLNLAHYLHRYLHRHIARSSNASTPTEETDKAPDQWRNQADFVRAATNLIRAIQKIIPTDKEATFFDAPPIKMDELFLNITSPCCHACNIAASHTVKIKRALGIYKTNWKRLPGLFLCEFLCIPVPHASYSRQSRSLFFE